MEKLSNNHSICVHFNVLSWNTEAFIGFQTPVYLQRAETSYPSLTDKLILKSLVNGGTISRSLWSFIWLWYNLKLGYSTRPRRRRYLQPHRLHFSPVPPVHSSSSEQTVPFQRYSSLTFQNKIHWNLMQVKVMRK